MRNSSKKKEVKSEEEVSANPCPNCHETNWQNVTVGTQTIKDQHRCINCGYVLTEE